MNLKLLGLFISSSAMTMAQGIPVKGGKVYADLSSSLEFTSNVEANSDEQEDMIWSITPSIGYQTEGAVFQFNSEFGVSIERYQETSENDSENVSGQLSLSYPNGLDLPYSMSADLSVKEDTGSDSEFGEVTRTRDTSLGGNFTYSFTALYGISTGLTYSKTEDLESNRSDTESYAGTLALTYRYSELLSYSAGYRIRFEESKDTDGISSTDQALFIGAKGQLTPLITGSIAAGAQIRQFDDDQDDEVAPYASGGLTWQVSSLTTASLGISADFETSTGNESKQSYTLTTGLGHSFDTRLNGSLTTSISHDKFSESDSSENSNRDDTEYQIACGLSTSFGRSTSASAALGFTHNDSGQSESTYDEVKLTLSISHAF